MPPVALKKSSASQPQPSVPYIKTRSGSMIPFAEPSEDLIEFRDIAFSLSRINRFTGYTEVNVAQHTREVGLCAMEDFEQDDPERIEAGLVGVAHDFVEAYIGDVSSPLKAVIKGDFRVIDHRFQSVIHKRFGLEKAREKHLGKVRVADMRCLYEDAIRFGMDGIAQDVLTGEDMPVDRIWVPKDFTPRLPNVLKTPVQAELDLWRIFTTMMVSSGRGNFL